MRVYTNTRLLSPCIRAPGRRTTPLDTSRIAKRPHQPLRHALKQCPRHTCFLPPQCILQGSQQQQPSTTTTTTTPSISSILGASALIVGSTVGAGMLALPSATAPLGAGPSSVVLLSCWLALLGEALLIAEVNITVHQTKCARRQAHDDASPQVTTLRQMAEATLGPAGSNLVTGTYMMLAYGLLVAYISRAGEALHHLSLDRLPTDAGMIISVAAVGTLLATGGPNAADGINRALTTALLILFVAIVAAGSGMVSLDTLASQPTDWSSLSTAFPIVFLTLVYHDLIPVLCMLLGHDRPAVRTALVAGSVLPLGMFLTWNTLVLGVSATSSAAGGDPLQAMIAATGGGVGMAVEAFSLLAVVTSFIGITLGITETAKTELPLLLASTKSSDGLQAPTPAAPSTSSPSMAAVYAITLVPAALMALSHPASFFEILQACGAYGMVLLYGILPPLMIMGLQQQQQQQPPKTITRLLQRLTTPGGLVPTLRLLGVVVRRPWLLGTTTPNNTATTPGGAALKPVLAMLISFSVAIGGTHALEDAKRITSRLSLSQLEALVAAGDVESGAPPAGSMVLVRDDGFMKQMGSGGEL